MGDLLSIGVSGLQAFKRELDTVSHNIANVNTEGYSRQRVDLATRSPDYNGFGYIGNGVGIDGVRRIVDGFLNSQILTNSTSLSTVDTFHGLVSRVDELLANADAGLTPSLQSFFNAAQDLADDPSSIPARQVFLSEAENMVDRLRFLDQQLNTLAQQTTGSITTSLNEVNSLAEGIATFNRDITTAFGGTNKAPNDLLDQRDQLIRELSSQVEVQVVEQSNGALNVFIGNGQALVIGNESRSLSAVNNAFDPSRKDIAISDGNTSVLITDQIRGGSIGGSLDFLEQVLYPARNELGRIGVGLTGTFNAQHRLGQDLDGNLGGDFFGPLNSATLSPAVLDGANNSSAGFNAISASYADVGQLTASDYQVRALGGGQYEVLRLSDNRVTTQTGPSFTVDGLQIDVNSPPSTGDTFLIRPTYQAASRLSVAISDPRAIAAALPVRTGADLANTGNGAITSGSVTDAAAYVPDDYSILLAADSGAVADGGVSAGSFTDNNNDSALSYSLSINGTVVYTQNEAAAPLADLNALAAAINGVGNANVAATGVRAYTDNNNLYLVNEPPTALPINITESLATTAGTVEDADTITGYFGSVLTGASAASNSISYAGQADSYVVLDGSSAVIADGAYTSAAPIAFNGIEVSVSGTPNLGDAFSVDRNLSGAGDNRNMLALAALQSQSTLDNGRASYLDLYGNLVAGVGAKTQQAGITREAASVLLEQSISAREETSGVNLDEEAANLIRFQQAYQAAAQVISTANDLFQTLLGAVGR